MLLKQDDPIAVSIFTACRNEIGHIREFLNCVWAQDLSEFAWEAIIADASDDGTREVLEDWQKGHPELTVIPNPRKIVSTGLNLAIGAARGDIIIRMDVHTVYAPDYCRRSIEMLERMGADNVGGPARTRPNGDLGRAIAAAYHSRFANGGARFHDESYEGWVDTVPYGCWRKATLERIGLFDENLVRSQDDELNLRLVRAGGRIWQSPQIVSWYVPRNNLRGLFRQYSQYGFWKVAVIRKYRLPATCRQLVPALFVGANLILILLMLATAPIAPKVSARIGLLWAAQAAAYLAATLAASVAAVKRCGWAARYLPAVFPTYHVSYGMGFLAGLIRLMRREPAAGYYAESAFTRISR
jgi:glycosyltransferase involved in cell wall biosynthesis